jgi:hypothetical protein
LHSGFEKLDTGHMAMELRNIRFEAVLKSSENNRIEEAVVMKHVIQGLEPAYDRCCGVDSCIQGENSFLEILKLCKSLEGFRVVLGA